MGCANLKPQVSNFGSRTSKKMTTKQKAKMKRCVKKVKAKGKVKSPHGVCRKAIMGKR